MRLEIRGPGAPGALPTREGAGGAVSEEGAGGAAARRGRRLTLQEQARRLAREVFIGGPIEYFELAGRIQLMLLIREGLYPCSRVLDIGCGCLRGGYWLIHFLEPGRYFGIEPNRQMLEAGIRILLEPGLAEAKGPRFHHNADFDFSVFEERFDFLVARSIWTHASKTQIGTMLDGFVRHATEGGAFLTSYRKAGRWGPDYGGEAWVGRSHESDTPGLVQHSLRWIRSECRRRGLVATEIRDHTSNFGGQTWVCIRRQAT